MYKDLYKEIWFIEGEPPKAVVIEPIKIELNKMFRQNQLKSLDNVKDEMVRIARLKQCNAIVNFKYGQKSTFLKSILGMDDVFWYGSGELAKIDPSTIEK